MGHDLAILTWKNLRLDKLEQKVILEMLNWPIWSYEANRSKLLIKPQFEEYQRYFSELSDEGIQPYEKSYKYAQKLHQKNIVVEKYIELIESDYLLLLKTMQRLIELRSCWSNDWKWDSSRGIGWYWKSYISEVVSWNIH